jgi:K+/H+ antiporter YhaU regulatory subunit KhtT
VAAVGFAIGSQPGLSEQEALELAELLGRRRSLAAQSAARKIRKQAGRDADHEMSQNVELDHDELREVAAVLAEPRAPEELPAFLHLREEITLALGD